MHQFLQIKVVGEDKTYPIKLNPGKAVFFHSDRLIHGRKLLTQTKKFIELTLYGYSN